MESRTAPGTEIKELKSEISGLRADLKRFIEKANQQHVDNVLQDLKKNYGDLIANHQVEAAGTTLSDRMVRDCAMRDKCFAVFMDFLQTTSGHIRDGSVTDEVIAGYRDQVKALRVKGPYERCDTCFSEVYRLFEKQVDLMRSLGIYLQREDTGTSPAEVPDEEVAKQLLEPVASPQRFQILKALAVRTRTFSELSQMTGLRGGNLLFHLRKLADSGMILQRHERGDYIITDKGWKTVTTISELYRTLHPENLR
ncbi:DNA-binding transcriptional ArsR family regulator [Methanolinea mesophila]|uniref:winged helix-turn-helix domain-containing protein n=1 Tax=Methanolinea mesophila TaxID=547055 RepID=UPI001AEAC5A3|nr:winged helix-turn-helix domain-containing protein [Methanolinea mesophila]MBP1928964.1 DNA-binding transcriptional ArsR family regulator [Methanolinea mesophila]